MVLLWVVVFVVAVAALVKGADYFLDTAKKVGEWVGLSAFTIGVVIVGFGTSLPELVSSLAAQTQGVSDIVAANVIGSNIANILFIAGFAAVMLRGVTLKLSDLYFDAGWLAMTTVFLVWIAFDGVVTVGESLVALVLFAIYALAIYAVSQDNRAYHAAHNTAAPTPKDWGLLVVGLMFLIGGAHYTVEAAQQISGIVGIGTGVIGLLAIAVGTSLPEFAVTLQAARGRGGSDIAMGNIFGSNVFNALMVIGLPGLLGPMVLDATSWWVGLPFMIGATALLVYGAFQKKLTVTMGGIALVGYAAFVLLAIV